MDSGLLAEPVIGPATSGPHPLARPGMTNRGSILANAEFTTGRGVAKASDAVAVAFDDRVAPLEPLAVARHEARLFRLVDRPWDHPDIGVAGRSPTRHAVEGREAADAARVADAAGRTLSCALAGIKAVSVITVMAAASAPAGSVTATPARPADLTAETPPARRLANTTLSQRARPDWGQSTALCLLGLTPAFIAARLSRLPKQAPGVVGEGSKADASRSGLFWHSGCWLSQRRGKGRGYSAKESLAKESLAKEVRAASSRRHAGSFAGRPKRSQLALSGKGRTKIPARPR